MLRTHPYLSVRTAIAACCCWITVLLVGFSPTIEPLAPQGVAPADTMEITIEEGTVLTTLLPETLSDETVRNYRLVEGPPFSGVARRSLAWAAADAAPGTYTVTLVPDIDEPTDTLFVRIQVDANR